MDVLTLELDDYVDIELKEYLNSLNGIKVANIDYNKITIKYDSKIISVNIIFKEIEAFLKKLNVPTLISFKKITNNKLKQYHINIIDNCCEYCLMGMIEDLLIIDGIEEASSEFFKDYKNHKDIKIDIKYDPTLLSLDKIKEIEKDFNN